MQALLKYLCVIVLVMIIAGCFPSKQISWTAIGDSITYLNDHPDETGNRVTKGYMQNVTDKLAGIHYINKGYNGWTASGIAEKINELGIEKSDVYSVLLGTNDWWQGKPIGQMSDYKNNTGNGTYYGSVRIIVDKIKSLNKDALIILMTPLQRSDFVYIGDMKNNAWGSYKEKNGQSLAGFANAVKEICSYEHFKLVDLYNDQGMKIETLVKFKKLKDPQTGAYKNYTYPEYTNIPFNPETDEYPYPPESIDVTYDGLHPSDKGNAIIAKHLITILKDVSKK